MLNNFNLHYPRLSLKEWGSMLLAAEGQLGHHPIPRSRDPQLRSVSRHEAHFGIRPGASAWIPGTYPGHTSRPERALHVPRAQVTSGHRLSDAGIFVRPCAESRGWVVRCLRTRKLVVCTTSTSLRTRPRGMPSWPPATTSSAATARWTRRGRRSLPFRRESPRATGYPTHCGRPAHWRAFSSGPGSGC